MGKITSVGSVVTKVAKIILIMIILIIYRVGNNGNFLGVGGTFNLNEDKTVDVEILASGVLVGFLVYTLSVLITFILTGERLVNECIMNVIGIFLFAAVTGTALHYWKSYAFEHQFEETGNERGFGLAVGVLSLFTAILYLVDTVFSAQLYSEKNTIIE